MSDTHVGYKCLLFLKSSSNINSSASFSAYCKFIRKLVSRFQLILAVEIVDTKLEASEDTEKSAGIEEDEEKLLNASGSGNAQEVRKLLSLGLFDINCPKSEDKWRIHTQKR